MHHIQILNDGGSLCIFPEGWMTRDGNLLKAHGGVAYLLEKTGVPVVPVAISGAFKLSIKKFITRGAKITVTFGTPVYKKELFSNPVVEVEEYKTKAQIILDHVGDLLGYVKTTPDLVRESFDTSETKA